MAIKADMTLKRNRRRVTPFILENLEPITLTRDYSNYSIYNYIQGDARIVGIAFDKLYYTYSEIIVDDEFYEEISTYEKQNHINLH